MIHSRELSLAPMLLASALSMAMLAPAAAQEPSLEATLGLMREADARYRSQDWAGVSSLLERAVETNPHMAEAWFRLAIAYSGRSEHRLAISAYEKALELGADTASFNVAYEIARAHAFLGEREDALAWLRRALDTGLRRRELVRADEAFAFLREDPDYQALALPLDTASMSRDDCWRHDLSFLELEVARLHHDPFRKLARADFEGEVRRLQEEVPALTDNQVIVRLMALMSKVGDAHTICAPEFVWDWTETVPLQFGIFQEGLFVVSAAPGSADLAGAQVLRVAGHAAEHVLAELGRIISQDNPQGVLRSAPNYLRYPQVLNGLGLQDESDRIALTVRGRDGKERSVTVPAAPNDPAFDRITGHPQWVAAYEGSPAPLPLYLKDRRTAYWFEHLPDRKTVYFQLNLVTNQPSEPLEPFIDRLSGFIDEHEVERLVIDLRWNNGGNTVLLPPLLRALSRDNRVNRPGHLFVIVGRYTFSAGMNAVALIERYCDPIIVGEPTPSSPNFTGESNILRLPCHSRLHVSVSDLYWQGAWPFDRRTWIAPVLYTPPSFEAYRAKRDPALEAILACPLGD